MSPLTRSTARPRYRVTIHPDPLTIHSWSVLCGLSLLHGARRIDFRIGDLGYAKEEPYTLMLEVEDCAAKQRMRASLAVGDAGGYPLTEREHSADIRFRRSAISGDGTIPLGLLFGVESGHEPLARYVAASLMLAVRTRSLRPTWKTLRALSQKGRYPKVQEYEGKPRVAGKPRRVIFQTTAWDPDSGADPHDRILVNEHRAELIRQLREGFGEQFIGGFVPNTFAQKHYGDLLTDEPTNRSAYLRRVGEADIGIASIGLHKSTPWKIPEYFAAGCAILTEPLHFEVGPDPGSSLSVFTSVPDCVTQLGQLLSDPDSLSVRQANALEYWAQHVRPDRVMARLLSHISADYPN